MLRKIAKALLVSRAWIVSIAFLAPIFGIIESSKPFQCCIKDQYARSATENFEKGISSVSVAFDVYLVCLGHFTHDNAEAIIAAFTIVIALSTVFLWVATRDLVRGAEKTAKQQLRAYLSVENATRLGSHSLTPKFSLRFKNCGQTPAYNVIYWVDVKVHKFPFDSGLIPSKNKIMGRLELPPTMGFSCAPINSDNIASIPTEHEREFSESKIAFYIFGRLDFDDAFGEPRWLELRLVYLPESMSSGALVVDEIKF